ncbi:O-acetyltransferase OatA [Legionella massiliensis]|uniref:O-acetyltransferase OatA n=1 Tax=Legionella massiliensis TaxID=1034943 RepID=A0A078KT37_9GAMM|nr:acyltransferase family protein [Legionella massiliensis]CDZ76231.1 O-acetyltransferase OatA [Legionella massiliensis]CEE11969.1 O-acetyltransferase OatA [Legionella massiliensis]
MSFLKEKVNQINVGKTINYRADIDGLRAIAVLSVLVFHAFPAKFSGGFIGVDIFFVISGYLISRIIFEEMDSYNRFNYKNFYVRRINRILPALLVVLFSVFLIGWFVLLPDEYKELGKHISAASGFSSNLLLWKSADYFDIASELKPLLHLWSLGVEEQFYLIWPILIFIAYKLRFNVPMLVLFCILISFWLNLKGLKTDRIGAFYLPHMRFYELLSGSLLASLHSDKIQQVLKNQSKLFWGRFSAWSNVKWTQDLISILGFLLILFAFHKLSPEKRFPGKNAFYPVIGAFLLIAAGREAFINRHILANRFLVWIGLISFPLYLWHWPLLSFARIMEQQAPSRLLRFGCLFISFVLAALTYYFIEKPIRFGKHRVLKATILFVLLICFFLIGIFCYKQKGFPFRVSTIEIPLSAHKLTYDKVDLSTCLFTAGEGQYCISTNPGETEVLILGNSHAVHLWPGLVKTYPNTKMRILTSLLCFPVEGLNDSENCLTFYKNRLLQNRKTIIFSALYATTNHDDPRYPYPPLGPEGIIFNGKQIPREDISFWEPALRDLLNKFIERDNRIILTYQVPELFHDMKDCIDNRPVRISKKTVPNCNIPRKIVDERQAPFRKILNKVLKDYPQVEVFDPLKYFCDSQWCYATKNGNALYFDHNHLSVKGSEFYAESFVKEFPSLLPNSLAKS